MASSLPPPPQVLLRKVEKAFREYLPQDCDHLLGECTRPLSFCLRFETHNRIGVKLCQNYDLSAEELFWKWEAVKHSSREAHRLDASNLQELRLYITKEQVKSSKPTKKGSSAQLSGVMSARSGASGYGPRRIPRQLGGGFMSGVKKEEVDRPVPLPGSSKISFSQVDKVEKRECECQAAVTAVTFTSTKWIRF